MLHGLPTFFMLTDKAASTDSKTEQKPEATKKSTAALEEDDEFEDFPVEGTDHSPHEPPIL